MIKPIDLPGLLEAQRNEILARWLRRISREHGDKELSRAELRDHLPTFFDEVLNALRAAQTLIAPQETETSSAAPAASSAHGTQRLRVGFDVVEVVREYEILSECILDEIEAKGGAVSTHAFRRVQHLVNAGRAEAISAYIKRRDAEAADAHARHIAFIAHELRNPLAPAFMALSALRRNARPEDEWALGAAMRSLTTLRELIDQVLIHDRLEAHPQPVREPLDIRALIEQAVTDASLTTQQRQLAILIQAPQTLPFSGDPRVLRSAISNLLGNAIKFTHEGEKIAIRAERRNSSVNIEVEDGCGGLPEGNPQDLFKPFLQRGADRSGFGLGLAIVKQGIEAHGGKVSVTNLPGKGCVFTLELPDEPPATIDPQSERMST